MLDPSNISFRRLTMDDLPLMYRWLTQAPAVLEFYSCNKYAAYEEVVAKYGPRIRGEQPTRCFLIMYGNEPIGHIQTYLWRDYPDYAAHLNLNEESASVDVFIAHEDYIHKGLGADMLTAFLREIVFADASVCSCVITPETRNVGAIRAYEKAGFERLRVLEHPGEPGPVYLMRIARDECLQRQL